MEEILKLKSIADDLEKDIAIYKDQKPSFVWGIPFKKEEWELILKAVRKLREEID